MADLLRRSWKFILERLSTSTLSVVLYSVIIPVVVFVFTSAYAWHALGGRVTLAQILKETVAPTAIGIGVALCALLVLWVWGIVATLLGDYRSMKETILERDKEIERLQTGVQRVAQTSTTDPWLSLLHARKNLEVELQPLLEQEEAGIKVVPKVKIGKDESDYRRERINRLRRDIEDISKRLASEEVSKDTEVSLPIAIGGLRRDWPGDWKELSGKFAEIAKVLISPISADYFRNSDGESWSMRGGPAATVRNLESLCKLAGNLLIASPSVARRLPSELHARTDPVHRWLFYLKNKGSAFNYTGYGTEILNGGKEAHCQMGSIEQLAAVSASECIACAADEFAPVAHS
jgi:hypothetical protein